MCKQTLILLLIFWVSSIHSICVEPVHKSYALHVTYIIDCYQSQISDAYTLPHRMKGKLGVSDVNRHVAGTHTIANGMRNVAGGLRFQQITEDYDYVEGLGDDVLPNRTDGSSTLSPMSSTLEPEATTEVSPPAVTSQTVQIITKPTLPPFPQFPPGFPFNNLPAAAAAFFNITLPSTGSAPSSGITFNTPMVIITPPVIPAVVPPILSFPPYTSFPPPPPIFNPPPPPTPPIVQLCYNYGTPAQYCKIIN